ncbi:MAG: glutathione S-transferase family protein [Pseudomonadota bacterium]
MLTIYHARFTRGFRAIWVCEELAVPYQVVPVDFSPVYRATPEWRAINPVGKVPAMRDGDFTMYESGAMMQHIVDAYGNGRLQPPIGSHSHAHYLQWCWFAESTLSRPLGEITNHRREFPEPIEACMEEMRARARLCVQALSDHLLERTYMVDETFSGADIMVTHSMRGFVAHCPDDVLPDSMQRYLALVQARPAFQATVAADDAATV